jgi:hypothetical protein
MRGDGWPLVPLDFSVVKCDGVLGGDGLANSVIMSMWLADLFGVFADLTCSMVLMGCVQGRMDCNYRYF